MKHKIGILMIGSLYWGNSDSRVKWRQDRLENEEFDVSVPIRYGRKSKSRNNTYTMVFSQLCKRKNYGLGIAKVITCKNKAKNIDDVIEEARLLWAAERDQEKVNSKFWGDWGSIGLLCNPNSIFPENYFSKWSNMTTSANDYGKIDHTKSEKSILTKNGILNISWPIIENTDESLPFDIILTTVTNPTLVTKHYPNVKTIAKAWKQNNEYFLNNRKSGIRTFQDKTIAKLLNLCENN